MKNRILPKDDLPVLIGEWMRGAAVYAPVSQGSITAFQLLSEPAQANIAYFLNTRYPPKALFLPQSEALFRVRQGQFDSTEHDTGPRVILGIRPCDIQGVQMLDTIFVSGDAPDPYWAKRREQTTIVGLGCKKPGDSCFCTSVGSGPFDSRGADLMLTETGDAYVIEVFTKKGQILVRHLKEASPSQADQMLQIRLAAAGKMSKAFSTEGIQETLYRLFENDFWQTASQSCLGCGVCTYLCPTCHCFDIVDEAQRSERVRNWDSCMFRIYSQEASGHNPRPSGRERLRQRIMHKYAYFPELFQTIACTGCGRCVRFCPVNLDIRTLIRTAGERNIIGMRIGSMSTDTMKTDALKNSNSNNRTAAKRTSTKETTTTKDDNSKTGTKRK